MTPKRKAKYRNRKTVVDGITFDSAKEARRYGELKLLLRAGQISNLSTQCSFQLAPGVVINDRKRPALRYIADFVYLECGAYVVEDCKGYRTEGYRIKRHLMKAIHGIDILET